MWSPRVRFTVRRMMVAVAVAAVIFLFLRPPSQDEGSQLLGVAIVLACVGGAAMTLASGGVSLGRHSALRALALAAVIIGVPDLVFLAVYWWHCGGRWYGWTPEPDGYPLLNTEGVCIGAAVALGAASLLRLVLWPRLGRTRSGMASAGGDPLRRPSRISPEL